MEFWRTILFAVIQLALAYLGIHVSMSTPKTKRGRWLFVITFVILGAASIVFAAWQESINEKTNKELSNNITELKSQIVLLMNATRVSATSDDMGKLGHDINLGFNRVLSAISGKPAPEQTQQSVPQVPTVENTRLIQKPTTSDNPSFPYGLQVIIQSNITIQPVGFGLQCDGEIGDFRFFIAGQGAYMNVREGHSGNTLEFGFSFPTLTPESSLVVTILSKTQIRVIKAYKLNL